MGTIYSSSTSWSRGGTDGGGGSGGGWSSSSHASWPLESLFGLEAILLPPNGGICGSGSEPWVCLGVVPKMHPTMNLWVRRRIGGA